MRAVVRPPVGKRFLTMLHALDPVDLMQVGGGMIGLGGYVPQIVRILKLRSAEGLSLGMWASTFAAVSLTEVYAVDLAMDGRPTVLLTNSISMLLSGTLIVLILRFGDGAGTGSRRTARLARYTPRIRRLATRGERAARKAA